MTGTHDGRLNPCSAQRLLHAPVLGVSTPTCTPTRRRTSPSGTASKARGVPAGRQKAAFRWKNLGTILQLGSSWRAAFFGLGLITEVCMYKHTLRCPLTLDSVLCVCGPTNAMCSGATIRQCPPSRGCSLSAFQFRLTCAIPMTSHLPKANLR